MVILVTYKNKEDPQKIKGARVVTTFLPLESMEIFSDAQGQLILQSVFGFSQNLNSVKTLWLS